VRNIVGTQGGVKEKNPEICAAADAGFLCGGPMMEGAGLKEEGSI
jgi:hypothetical protein